MDVAVANVAGKARSSRQLARIYFACGIVSFLLCCGLSLGAWRLKLGSSEAAIVTVPIPNQDCYLSYQRRELDTAILYYGLDAASLEHLKKADVLFLGNSRVMFACREENLQPFFQRHGLNYFVLSFANAESGVLPLDIVRRFDLHPRLLIIDPSGFFSQPMSRWADKIVRGGKWEALKLVGEDTCGFWVQHYLHRAIPKWKEWEEALSNVAELTAFRSRAHGESYIWYGHRPDLPLVIVPSSPAPPPFDALATEYLVEMKQRGARALLHSVPTTNLDLAEGPGASAILDAPLIEPPHPSRPYTTVDGSHLSAESAARYMDALLNEIEKTAAFQEVVQKRVAPHQD
jgi:hypothetical protein